MISFHERASRGIHFGMGNIAAQVAPHVREARPRFARLSALGLVLLMALGSLAIWIGSPLFWLWLTSKLQSGTQASMGPYLLLLVGLIATSIVLARALSRLNAAYARVTRSDALVGIHLPWHRMRGAEHENRSRPVTVLDVVMVISVILAAIAFAVWFFIVQPTPPGLEPGPSKD
jgi:hypothetical protein